MIYNAVVAAADAAAADWTGMVRTDGYFLGVERFSRILFAALI